MNKEKKKYTVTIFGDQYVLVSDEGREHVMKIASIVDSLMHDIADVSQLSDAKKVAVLANLRMADKILTLESEAEKSEKRCEAIANRIDEKSSFPVST